MEKIEMTNFDLKQIADSGQCFRMTRISENGWSAISKTHRLEIFQNGKELLLDCPENELAYWKNYFDLDTDYAAFIRSIPEEDTYLTKAAASGDGIRILRQDLWEMMVTFLLSQQKTIPKIREAVELLSAHYGTPLPDASKKAGKVFFTFPTPEELGHATLDDLTSLKLGYRAKYLYRLCRSVNSGEFSLDLLSGMNYTDAMNYLTGLYGIGEKVANCICLFALHHIDAFPVDTWIRQIFMKHYYPRREDVYCRLPKSRIAPSILQDYFSRYRGYAGVMQQYIFYYERTSSEKSTLQNSEC